MNTVFIAWQDAYSPEWIPLARLQYDGEVYRLAYLRGAKRARGFTGFGRMTELDLVYESKALFAPFANRIMSRSRPEYSSYLRWAGLDRDSSSLDVLAVTGGMRGTDSLEMFAAPVRNEDGLLSMRFFARGLRQVGSGMMHTVLDGVEAGQRLRLLFDDQNELRRDAVALYADNFPGLIVSCPDYCRVVLGNILRSRKSALSAHVFRFNPDAPSSMRLLCEVTANVEASFEPFAGHKDFLPIADVAFANIR